MTMNEIIIEFSRVEVMIDTVSDLSDGAHHEAAALAFKRLSKIAGEFKGKLEAALKAEKDKPLLDAIGVKPAIPEQVK